MNALGRNVGGLLTFGFTTLTITGPIGRSFLVGDLTGFGVALISAFTIGTISVGFIEIRAGLLPLRGGMILLIICILLSSSFWVSSEILS